MATDATPGLDLLETDGEPLESAWHRHAIGLLVGVLLYHLRDRRDFYCGGTVERMARLERLILEQGHTGSQG